MSTTNQHLWGGRFNEAPAAIAHRYSSSIAVDGRLYREDIAGSIAHARMLAAVGVIGEDEAGAIVAALEEIRDEIDDGRFLLSDEHEDVHMAIEGRLIGKIGAVGGKLHTGRSRNDQVAVDERLWLRGALDALSDGVTDLQQALLTHAIAERETVMPGYTHTQRAQPVLLAHHLLAYVAMLDRDHERLHDCRRRVNRSPLGAAAFAGTPFPIDRAATARALGFDGIVGNSIDAVADRDYLIEAAAVCATIMMHLSRLAEELVLWSSSEFAFITIGDAFTTGSSIMPQKKNPDMAELVRGRVGHVYGDLIALLTMMKGLPLAYNRDMQEDKAPAFDAVDTTLAALRVMAPMIAATTFDRARLEAQSRAGFALATELADYLVGKGVPFREAHGVTGRVVAHCAVAGIELHDLDLPTLASFSPLFAADVAACFDPRASVARKRSAGSTAPAEVEAQIEWWNGVLGGRGVMEVE